MPSLRRNIVANYVGQFYMAFAGILVLPHYLKYLGPESYGLVGFFTLLQAWMVLLDMGLSPTLAREVASLRCSPADAVKLRTVARSLETIFVFIATVGGLSLYFGRHWVANVWLTLSELDPKVVADCVGLMAAMIGLRLLSSLYKSGLNAYEQQVWLNLVEIFLVTIRFPGALLLLAFHPGQIFLFFVYQLAIGGIELLVFATKFYSLLPSTHARIQFLSRAELRRIAPFALGVAYTGAIWVLITQLDKLILSKVISLSEFGYFTLVATISSGLMLVSNPINRALLPRMTSLLAQGREGEMLTLYRRATRGVSCVIGPVVLLLTFFPREIVYIWTGDIRAAAWSESVLPLFVLGSGFMALGSFQYYLQYAHGKIRMHVIYNTVTALVSIPMIVYAALEAGPVGVGCVWLFFRIVGVFVWCPYVHSIFAPQIQKAWLVRDVLLPLLIAFALISPLILVFELRLPVDRVPGLIAIVLAAIFAIGGVMAATFSDGIKKALHARF